MAQHERGVWLIATLLAVVLTRVISERVTRLRVGGLTPVATRAVMPDFQMIDPRGGQWRLEDHRGQAVVVNLWATWCGPCLSETPSLVKAAGELGGEGVSLVGVSLDAGGSTAENRAKVTEFAKHYRVTYPVGFAVGGIMNEFSVPEIPTTILVDREGRVAKRYPGMVTAAVLEADVRSVLRGD